MDFRSRFAGWLVVQVFLHFVLALPGLLLLRAVSLGRWPGAAQEEGPRGEGWYPASAVAGAALWAAGAYGLVRLLR